MIACIICIALYVVILQNVQYLLYQDLFKKIIKIGYYIDANFFTNTLPISKKMIACIICYLYCMLLFYKMYNISYLKILPKN